MCLPISGWIWKTRNAPRKTAAAKTDRLIRRALLVSLGGAERTAENGERGGTRRRRNGGRPPDWKSPVAGAPEAPCLPSADLRALRSPRCVFLCFGNERPLRFHAMPDATS